MKKPQLILITAICFVLLLAASIALVLRAQSPAPQKPEEIEEVGIDESEISRMIGQMIMVGFRGDGADNLGDIPYLTRLVAKGRVGGVILFSTDVELRSKYRNVVDAAQLKRLVSSLQAAAEIPLFIAVDQEGGQVQRLKPEHGFTRWPSPEDMAHMNDAAVEQIGLDMGAELKKLGINLNFAPCVDLNINPKSPIIGMIGRSFGAQADIVTQKASAFLRGLNRAGVTGCLKHFPGHGSAKSDTHKGAADVSSTWHESELEPYRALLRTGGEYGVMVAHVYNKNFADSYPATLSPAVINGMLRRDLGWQGVVFTDDMQMQAISANYPLEEAVRLSVEAGADVLVFGNNYGYSKEIGAEVHKALMKLYRDGVISAERIEKSYTRIMRMKAAM